ncbi:MAG: hypothetical protein BWY91_03174 [bacterium ADurb.BinA028]|nr:MAG: hypothetical protein BWY91_03174 [bacterium ADurb.BinA028]
MIAVRTTAGLPSMTDSIALAMREVTARSSARASGVVRTTPAAVGSVSGRIRASVTVVPPGALP